MYSVEEIICQLLLRHTCVIIPSFGGFVAQTLSATIDREKGIINPPSKHVLFNKNLINNDGLLTSEYATFNRINYTDSLFQIDLFTGNLKSELSNGRKVELNKIGTFHLDAEKNICFEQNRYFNFLLSAYGLSNVQFVSTPNTSEKIEEKRKEITEIKIPIIQIETPIISIGTAKKPRKVIRYVAIAACFLPIAFYSFWIPAKTDVLKSGLISIHDFNPFYKTGKGLYLPSAAKLKALNFENVSYVPPQSMEITTVEPEMSKVPVKNMASAPKTISVSANSRNKRQAFEYIVGCFSNNSNALNLVITLKNQGFDATIITGGNLTRVSIGSAPNSKSLDSLIQLSSSKGYQGWILK